MRAKQAGYQLSGITAIVDAMDAGVQIRLLLVVLDTEDAEIKRVMQRARDAEIPIREASPSQMRRMSAASPTENVLALVGRNPHASVDELFTEPGALWLLVGVAYPGNVGMAIRTAEVSGAQGVFVDAEFDHDEKRNSIRRSVRADWFMPVHWESADEVVAKAKASGRRIVCIEVDGDHAPWEEDLTDSALFVVGGEADGIPELVMQQSDSVIRIPMHGFIPAYNLQAAVSAVATERVRQLELKRG